MESHAVVDAYIRIKPAGAYLWQPAMSCLQTNWIEWQLLQKLKTFTNSAN